MRYKIMKMDLTEADMRPLELVSKFPFKDLEVGEGFYVPNIEAMPPGENKLDASTFQNMKVHCSIKGRKLSRKFKCTMYDANWIKVWRQV